MKRETFIFQVRGGVRMKNKWQISVLILGIFFILSGFINFEQILSQETQTSSAPVVAEEDVVSFGFEDEEEAEVEEETEADEEEVASAVEEDTQDKEEEIAKVAKLEVEGIGSLEINVDGFFLTFGVLFILLFLVGFKYRWYEYKKIFLPIVGSVLFISVLVVAGSGSQVAVIGILAQSIRLATPVILGAMVGIICEKSGVINIGIEGKMLLGACFGFLGAIAFNNPFMGVLIAVLSGLVIGSLHAVLSITFRCDQIISGTFVNILAIGLTGFLRAKYIVGSTTVINLLPTIKIPVLHHIPILGPLIFTNKPIVLFMFLCVIVLTFVLFKTTLGLKTRAVGEHPEAADSVGIFVNKLRYINVIFAGGLAGVAGAWFSVETTGTFDDLMTNGKGFIALAAMIFGRYNPVFVFLGALLFGFADAVQIKLQIARPDIPYQFLSMIPYIVTMVVLAGVIGKAHPPKAVGRPYFKE